MQNKVIRSLFNIGLLSLLLVPAACQRVDQPKDGNATMRVRMDLSIDRWDTAETKGDTDSWTHQAAVFVQLTNGSDSQVLEATYNGGDGQWSIGGHLIWNESGWWEQTPMDLTSYSGGHCKCYYFERDEDGYGQNFERKQDGTLGLWPTTAIYFDDDAIFSIVDGELGIKAHLEPLTGRIRFANPGVDEYGGSSTWYSAGVDGMGHYTSLDLTTFEIHSSTAHFSLSINNGEDWTPYGYGFFPDPNRRTLTVSDDKYGYPSCYERTFAEDILAPGCSNWSYLPISSSHNEWYRYSGDIYGGSLGINDEDFRMLYVVPGTFEMGGEDAQPVHKVTLTKGYYLSQAEITKNMWYQVMGSPNDYANKSVPVTGKSWDEVLDFIATLNSKTGYRFRLPTEAEWEFAARGGTRSNGYLYSGSDRYSDVAVHDWNWSVQAVKTRDANELGFHDMSGNVSEWVSDWYAVYPTDPVVDPTGPETGEVHLRRGGNRGQDTRFLTVTYRDAEETDWSMAGFRLAMDAPRIK